MRIPFLLLAAVIGLISTFTVAAFGDPPDADLRDSIQAFLQTGLVEKDASLQELEQRYESLRAQVDDPRPIRFAYGLALLGRMKHREALAEFVAASYSGEHEYVPAWQARIRMRLLFEDRDKLRRDLRVLAHAVADEPDRWESDEERLLAASWLGHVVGVLALPSIEVLKPLGVTAADAQIRNKLSGRHRAAYWSGRVAARQQYQELQAEIAKRKKPAQLAEAKQAEQEAEELAAEQEESQEKAEKLDLTAREWDAWIKERIEKLEKRRMTLEKDFSVLAKTLERLQAEFADRQLEIRRVATLADFRRNRWPKQIPPALRYEAELLESEWRYLEQRAALTVRMEAVLKQAQATVAARDAAIERYEKATGKIFKQKKRLTALDKKMEKRIEELKAGDDKEPAEIRILKKKLSRISTYLPLDVDAERRRVLDAYGLESDSDKAAS